MVQIEWIDPKGKRARRSVYNYMSSNLFLMNAFSWTTFFFSIFVKLKRRWEMRTNYFAGQGRFKYENSFTEMAVKIDIFCYFRSRTSKLERTAWWSICTFIFLVNLWVETWKKRTKYFPRVLLHNESLDSSFNFFTIQERVPKKLSAGS